MNFTVKILGNGSALPTSYRNPASQVVNYNERLFLLDCGEGTQARLRQYKVKFSRINNIFISHLHGDHIFGLFGLLSSFDLLGRKTDLNIYAPKQLKYHLNILAIDHFSYKINFVDLKKGFNQVYEDKNLRIHSFPVKHSIECYGFLFQEIQKQPNIKKEAVQLYNIGLAEIQKIKKGADLNFEGEWIPNSQLTIAAPKPKSYAYCTDTKYTESILEYIRGVDLLYHESTFTEDLTNLARSTYHSTTRQAAEIATKAGVKKLLLGHFSSREKDNQIYLKQAKNYFQNTKIAEEGIDFEV